MYHMKKKQWQKKVKKIEIDFDLENSLWKLDFDTLISIECWFLAKNVLILFCIPPLKTWQPKLP